MKTFTMLPEKETIVSNKYCVQLDELNAASDEKNPRLVYRKHYSIKIIIYSMFIMQNHPLQVLIAPPTSSVEYDSC